MHYFDQIWELVIEVLALPDEDYGVYPEFVPAVEGRLTCTLPVPLSSFHLQFGTLSKFLRSHSRILAWNEINILNGCLVFCVEQQGVCLWGVPLDAVGRTDPPVVQCVNQDGSWLPYSDSLIHFLNACCVWQAVYLLPSIATGDSTPAVLARFEKNLGRLETRSTGPKGADLLGFYTERLVVCVFPNDGVFYVGAHEDARLEAFEAEFDVTLSWL